MDWSACCGRILEKRGGRRKYLCWIYAFAGCATSSGGLDLLVEQATEAVRMLWPAVHRQHRDAVPPGRRSYAPGRGGRPARRAGLSRTAPPASPRGAGGRQAPAEEPEESPAPIVTTTMVGILKLVMRSTPTRPAREATDEGARDPDQHGYNHRRRGACQLRLG